MSNCERLGKIFFLNLGLLLHTSCNIQSNNLDSTKLSKCLDLLEQIHKNKEKIKNLENVTKTVCEETAALNKEKTQILKELKELEAKAERRRQAQQELAIWSKQCRQAAELEASQMRKLFAIQNVYLNTEIHLYNAWIVPMTRAWDGFVQIRKTRYRKGYERQKEVVQLLQNRKYGYDTLLAREMQRFHTRKKNCEQAAQQESNRLLANIQEIDNRINRQSTRWTREQTAFWVREKEGKAQLISLWREFKSDLLRQFGDLERLWGRVSFTWDIRG